MKTISNHLLRRALLALVLLGIGAILLPLLHAQPNSAPAATNAAPATPVAVTNIAPANAAAPATNAASTDTVTPAAPADTNAPSAETEQAAPPSPGEMAAPGTELIGPPAPGSQNAPAGSPPGPEGMPTNNPAVTDVTNNPGAVAGLGQRKIPFYFGLNFGEMYDDNILISPDGEKKDAFITHFSPSLDYQMGDQTAPNVNYLNLYFSPTVYVYDTKSGFDRTDYNGDIYYQHNWTRLSVGFEQNYQHLTDATLDEGTLVSRNIYTTKVTSDYAYNDNLTLYGTGTQQINSYPGITINEWDVDTYALYQVAPKLSIGAGPRFCFVDITGAPNETHQDLLFRLRYVPDPFFTASFEGGVEYLEYQSSQQGTQASRLLPIFDMNLTYSPIADTNLFIEAGRSTVNSFDQQGDTIDYTQVQAGASQIFLQKFTAVATGGYHMAEYQQSSGNSSGSSARSDDYYFAKGSLQWQPNDWLQVEASYQYSTNDSNVSAFTFTDNQVDLQSTVKF